MLAVTVQADDAFFILLQHHIRNRSFHITIIGRDHIQHFSRELVLVVNHAAFEQYGPVRWFAVFIDKAPVLCRDLLYFLNFSKMELNRS